MPKRNKEPNSEPQQLLVTRTEAARILSCSTQTVIRRGNSGQLKPIKLTCKTGGRVYFRLADVERLVEEAAA